MRISPLRYPGGKGKIYEKVKDILLSNKLDGCIFYDVFEDGYFNYISNDLDETMPTNYHLDALEFLKIFEDESVDIVLFDPPFSPRQVSECYRRLGKTVNFETTNSSFWSKLKSEIARILTPGGIVISCGWSSGGIGKNNGFEQLEILLVSHGGHHNDTICVVDKKRLNTNTILGGKV